MELILVVFDIAWQFGYGAIVLYLVGVSQVIMQVRKDERDVKHYDN